MRLEKMNEAYFKEVYAQTKNTVYAYVYARAKNREDAVDIFQEVYMELVKILKTNGSSYINSPAALLTDIAKKKLYAYYKQNEKLDTFCTDVFFSCEDEPFVHIENISADRETVREIYNILKKKDDIVLKIFFLYFQADMKLSEIAVQTGLNESSVKNKLYRTIRELREIMKREDENND
ncbi:MAG: sigma-70 family RNA polymerase sigma factor [Clostridia bacterium]|nr:sigma-70 family RNA polymerase sigma factor [Clostridia bacterium]